MRTKDPTLVNSLSAVISTDCTRNLSRHLASGGGSSFIAWSRTGRMCQFAAILHLFARSLACILWTSTSLPGSMRPLFGLTQYLEFPSQLLWGGKGPREPYCLGAVVLT